MIILAGYRVGIETYREIKFTCFSCGFSELLGYSSDRPEPRDGRSGTLSRGARFCDERHIRSAVRVIRDFHERWIRLLQ